jgi:hypothetical protein
MDEKLLILLGLGAIGYLAATNFNNDDDDNDVNEYHPQHTGLIRDDGIHNNIYQPQPPCEEPYLPVVHSNSPTISYSNYPNIPPKANVSPLNFGQMVNIKEDYAYIPNDIVQENYVPSDYIQLNEYGDNPDQIPIYNEATGNVGLPVSDMTDMGADNKYIYDRTLGSIGFTSTKIGGRRRGQADYIRGDLPILPDRGAWFQVSPDITNTLLDGALGNQQALGNQSRENYYEEKPKKPKKGKMMAMRTVETEEGQVIGSCDDEKPDYVDCIYKTFKDSGRQPTMNELKRMFSLQQETLNTKYGGFVQQH